MGFFSRLFEALEHYFSLWGEVVAKLIFFAVFLYSANKAIPLAKEILSTKEFTLLAHLVAMLLTYSLMTERRDGK